jgi:hypothetical protein
MSSGGTGNINYVLSSDGRRMENTIARLQARINTLNRQLGRLRTTQNAQARGANTALSSWARRLGSVLTGYVGIQQAIRLVNSELARNERLRKAASEDTMTVADAQAAANRSLGPQATGAERRDFFKRAVETASPYGIKPATAIAEAAEIFQSTSGEFTARVDQTMKSLGSVAPISRDIPEQIGELGGLIVALQRAAPAMDKDFTRGLAFELQTQSRITGTEQLTNFERALSSVVDALKPQGQKDQLEAILLAASNVATLSTRIGDPELARSSTTIAKAFGEVLAEFRPMIEGAAGRQLSPLELQKALSPTGGLISDQDRLGILAKLIPKLPEGSGQGPTLRALVAGEGVPASEQQTVLKTLQKVTAEGSRRQAKFAQFGTAETTQATLTAQLETETAESARVLEDYHGTIQNMLFGEKAPLTKFHPRATLARPLQGVVTKALQQKRFAAMGEDQDPFSVARGIALGSIFTAQKDGIENERERKLVAGLESFLEKLDIMERRRDQFLAEEQKKTRQDINKGANATKDAVSFAASQAQPGSHSEN